MRKITVLEIALIALLATGIAFAASGMAVTVFSNTTLNNATVNKTGYAYIGDASREQFFVSNVINGTISLNLTMQGSLDNVTWENITFQDYTNGSASLAPNAYKNMTTNATYAFWPDPGTVLPYVKVIISSNSTGVNTAIVNCSVFKQQ